MFQEHEYQTISINKAIKENIIVNLPTGSGKTWIAVKVMADYLSKEQSKLILFTAPNRELTAQQYKYFMKYFPIYNTKTLLIQSENNDKWDAKKWESKLESKTVLFATPEIFRNALYQNYIKFGDVGFLVFDECHCCVGNHPSKKIVTFFKENNWFPKVLGLTASFVHSKVGNQDYNKIEKAKIQLQETLQAIIFSPEGKQIQRDFQTIKYDLFDCKKFNDEIEDFMRASPANTTKIGVKMVNKFIAAGHITLTEFGFNGFHLFYSKCFFKQIKDELKEHEQYVETGINRKLQILKNLNDYINDSEFDKKVQEMATDCPEQSDKFVKLLELISSLQESNTINCIKRFFTNNIFCFR